MNYFLKGKRSVVKERRKFRIKETRVKLFSFLFFFKKKSNSTLTLPNISSDFFELNRLFSTGIFLEYALNANQLQSYIS